MRCHPSLSHGDPNCTCIAARVPNDMQVVAKDTKHAAEDVKHGTKRAGKVRLAVCGRPLHSGSLATTAVIKAPHTYIYTPH